VLGDLIVRETKYIITKIMFWFQLDVIPLVKQVLI